MDELKVLTSKIHYVKREHWKEQIETREFNQIHGHNIKL